MQAVVQRVLCEGHNAQVTLQRSLINHRFFSPMLFTKLVQAAVHITDDSSHTEPAYRCECCVCCAGVHLSCQ